MSVSIARPLNLRIITIAGTGEHGVGIGKREYLYEELGAGTVELMKTIKRTIDPLNLFNPGKVSVDFWALNLPSGTSGFFLASG